MSPCLFGATFTAALLGALAGPALAYVDPTAAGQFLQSLYLAMMTAVLALVTFPQRIKAAASRLWAAASRALGRRGGSRGSDAADR
ncbi:MAG: hypothetical protein VKQ33_03785 [Candidatus Sericytochromatia bacterium]|nr:hypothetical protein [Candidatus Sericytochromatia bacterium]